MGEEIYLLFYTTGNKRGDDMMKASALTRRHEIMNNGSFDEQKDIVIMCPIRDLASIKNRVKNIKNKYGDKYGKLKEFSLWSHGSIDGPTGSVNTSENSLDTKQMSIKGWSEIPFDWASDAKANFYGCRTGVEGEDGRSFVQKLSNCKNFTDVTVSGLSDYGYPSKSPSSYVKHSDNYISQNDSVIKYYPTYMVSTNSFKRRISKKCKSSKKFKNGKAVN